MQTSWGDQSPVIEAGGNVSVTYGLDEERVKAMLERQQEELFRKLRESNVFADNGERRLLEQQLQAVSAKLADIERSYEEELARRKAADAALAQLRGQLPEAQLENAQASLRQGDKDAAKSVFHGVLDKEGASVALAAYQLGQMAESDLNYAEAMRMYKKAVALEEDNPEYLLAAGKMAREMAEYKQAQEWLEKLRNILEHGNNLLDISFVLHELGLLYEELGRDQDAEIFLKRCIEITEEITGKDSLSSAVSMSCLAGIYRTQRKRCEAEQMFLRSLKIKEHFLGKNHYEVAICLNNLALIYGDQCEYRKSEIFHDNSTAIFKSTLGENHPLVACSMNNLAWIYKEQERYDEALKLYRRSLAIRVKIFGKSHPSVANSLNNMSGLYYKQCKFLRSKILIEYALFIIKKKFPATHPEVVRYQKNYDELKRKIAEQQ